MERVLRVAIVGLHDERIWQRIEIVQALPYAKIVAGADADYEARQRFAHVTDQPLDTVYEDGMTLLTHLDVDAVISGLPTNEHAFLVEQCADTHAAVLLEQPMAGSLDDVDRMVTAVQRTNIPFMVNFPRLWAKSVRESARMVIAGAVGDLIETRCRVCDPRNPTPDDASTFHKWLFDPTSSSSGVVMQLCSNGAQLAAWLMGLPTSVVGIGGAFASKDAEVFDNGVLLMKYPAALAVAEGSWSGVAGTGESGIEFHGTIGSLTITGSTLRFVDRNHPEGRIITPDLPPVGRSNGVEHFLHSLHRGTDFAPSCNLATSRAAQEILEGGRRAIETGYECPLPVR